MDLWVSMFVIFLGGALGGIVNALMTDNGFIFPKPEETTRGTRILRPGFLGNVLISGVAASISWGLYGAFGSYYLTGGPASSGTATTAEPGVTVAAFVGAILVGVAGARWLTNEVDKNLLRATAAEAATARSNESLAAEISTALPAEALRMAKQASRV